ncbi:MAG: SMC-Scp complex subunit ScpB [Candidatus Cloacimonetes bacterium]|nr:SMC-Scp complex subunit ScpB [Candidatus Cloacimonadota bacterium]MBL7107898.1 SMC-Scp complex subunit ScpB [Candidatus Cloacimonadota bacterium]
MDLSKEIEVLIFASDGPINLEEIAKILEIDNLQTVEKIIESLNNSYEKNGRTFIIRRVAGGYQFAANKQYYPIVEKLYKEQKKIHLSTSAMEVLAIIAYHQPITRTKIDAIRGVSSQYHIHNLLDVKLVKIQGRQKVLGRPLLYGTTDKFMKFFGLNNIEELPNIREIKEVTNSDISEPQKNISTKTKPE